MLYRSVAQMLTERIQNLLFNQGRFAIACVGTGLAQEHREAFRCWENRACLRRNRTPEMRKCTRSQQHNCWNKKTIRTNREVLMPRQTNRKQSKPKGDARRPEPLENPIAAGADLAAAPLTVIKRFGEEMERFFGD